MQKYIDLLGTFLIVSFFIFIGMFFISCSTAKVCHKVCAPGYECQLVCKPSSEWLN